MLTIPDTWKRDATDELQNLNSRGTPVYFMRITFATGRVIRLSTKTNWFKEEGGEEKWYESYYVLGISNIEQKIVLARDNVGGYSEQGNVGINISNGARDGDTFLEKYNVEWDDFVNATVEIWLTFNDIIDPLEQWYPSEKLGVDNAVKPFYGKIRNVPHTFTDATLIVEDWFEQDDIMIPYTLGEMEQRGLTASPWGVHKKHIDKVAPVNFGERYFPTEACFAYNATTRRFYIMIANPVEGTISSINVFFWDNASKAFQEIDNGNYALGNKIHDWYSFDVRNLEDLPEELKQHYVLQADSITEQTPPATTSNEGAINDSTVQSENEITAGTDDYVYAWVGHGALTYNVWSLLWRLTFKKKGLPEDEPFNVYVFTDLTQNMNTTSGLFSIRFDPALSGWSAPVISALSGFSTVLRKNYLTDVKLWANCPQEFFPAAAHSRNNTRVALALAQDADASDVPSNGFTMDIDVRRDSDPPTTVTMCCHECALFIVKLLPQITYAVNADFGNARIQDAINLIVDYFLGIDSATYCEYSYFNENYGFSGQISKRQSVGRFFRNVAEQLGLIYVETPDRKMRFMDLWGGTPLITKSRTIIDSDVNVDDDGAEIIGFEKSGREVYSRFEILFDKNLVTNEYRKRRYVTPNDNNLTQLTALVPEMEGHCYDAESKYGTDKTLTIKCDWAGSNNLEIKAVESILYKATRFFTFKPDIVTMQTSLRRVDLEIGDEVDFDMTRFSSENMHLIFGKKINTKENTIDFSLLQCIWKK